MAGLAAARRRGRVGGRPTVMTEAKTKQAARMVKAGTPLTEVAEVLGVSRTTLYRHLKTSRPGGVVAAVQRRADLAVLWLHPDPDDPGAVVEARHCRACHPRGRVVDVECTRCGDGPIVTGALAQDSASGSVAYPARRWLVAAGWSTAPDLVCPEH